MRCKYISRCSEMHTSSLFSCVYFSADFPLNDLDLIKYCFILFWLIVCVSCIRWLLMNVMWWF